MKKLFIIVLMFLQTAQAHGFHDEHYHSRQLYFNFSVPQQIYQTIPLSATYQAVNVYQQNTQYAQLIPPSCLLFTGGNYYLICH